MGIALPQLAPASEDRVSGAQVIDGSLRFDHDSNQYLKFTPTTSGNRRTWTFSCWFKKMEETANRVIFSSYGSGATPWTAIQTTGNGDGRIQATFDAGLSSGYYTDARYRNNGWYHLVWSVDTTQPGDPYKSKLYINGDLQTYGANAHPSLNEETKFNLAGTTMYIGYTPNQLFDGHMSQCYFLDGLSVGPEYFAYTDPLTDVWRPKKFVAEGTTVNDGTEWTTKMSNTSLIYVGSASNVFNGNPLPWNTSNYASFNQGTLTLLTGVDIEVKGSIKIFGNWGYGDYIVINGVNYLNDGDGTNKWITPTGVTYPFTLSSLALDTTPLGYQNSVSAVEIDGVIMKDNTTQNLAFGTNGFYLPMDGNSPIGEDKSGAPSPNDGTVWSNFATATGVSAGNVAGFFQGDTSSCSSLSVTTSGTFLLTKDIPNVTKIGVHSNAGAAFTMKVNEGLSDAYTVSVPTRNNVSILDEFTGFTGTIHTLSFSGFGAGTCLNAIEINGVLLIDNHIGNSWTPVNFGGSAALDKATGARPILNTVNGGTKAAPGVFGSKVSRNYTILGTSGGGLYRFEGIAETNPPLSFVRGATYIFDYSATSGAHPLAFSTTDPDSSTTSYTDGVNTATSNVTKITVPHDAPDTLYYYCTSHSTMNNAITVTTDETKADPYAWKNFLAAPLVGSTDDVSNQINCGSTKKIATSSSLVLSTQSNFYGGSHHWNYNTDTLQYAQQGNELVFGTGDYTIECWLYDDNSHNGGGSGGRCYIFDNRIGGSVVGDPPTIAGFVDGSNEFNFSSSDGNITYTVDSTANRWIHYAAVRSSGTTTLYLDGISVGTVSGSTNYPNNGIGVGRATDGGYGWAGFIQDFRVYTGVAKYTSNFIPASTNPDILPDSPSGAAFKSQLTTITDGAVAFDGSGDYLVAGTSSDLAVGSGDFTLECFVYRDKSVSAFTNFIATRGSAGSANGYTFGAQASSNGYDVEFYTNGLQLDGGNQKITPNRWHHVVLTRSGSTLRSFVNGILNTTTSNSQDFSNTSMTIGMTNDGSQGPMNGFISNVRVIKGSIPTEYQTSSTTVDTKIFIPPSRALTNVTNTKLLCCQSNTEPGGAAVAPNVSGINNGTQWSNYLTGAGGFQSSYPATNAFNGTVSASETSRSTNNGETQTFAPPVGIPYSSKVEVWTYYTGNVRLNGGSNVAVSDDQNWRTIATGSGTLNTLDFICNSGNSMYLAGIRIDSTTILLDPVAPKADAAATTFNPFNTDINTVLGQEGTYAVMNPLGKGSNVTLSRNNLRAVSGSSGNSYRSGYCNMAVPASGSYYCEATIGSTNGMVGIINADYFRLDNIPGCVPNSYAYYENGNKYLGDCNAASYGASFTTGDVIGMGIDRGTLTFYKNGVSQGPAMENLTGRYFFGFGSYNNTIDFNFGQKPFKFAPPRGHQPITSSTIREASLEPRPNKYCAPVIWTGSSLSVNQSRTITTDQADFIPDLVWVKTRTGGNEPPALYDSVRGDGTGNKRLLTDRTNAESTFSSGVSADLSGFVKGGFTVNGTNGHINGGTSYTHAGWMWKAGGKHNTFNIDDVGYANASDVNMNVGGLNSTMLRQDANYANASNFSGDTGGLTFTRMFNGTMGSGDVTASVCLFSPYGNSTSTTWTAPTTINNITKLRIYVDMSGTASGGDFQVNGIDYRDYLDSAIYGQITSGEDGWVTIPETHLSTIKFGRNSNNTIAVGICAVEVNDQILIDNQITAPNFPSIANDGCSVGTKNGFSIVTYTGNGSAAQLAHGLGDYPDFILHKFRTASSNWSAWTPFFNQNTRVIFNDDDGMSSDGGSFIQYTKHTFNVHSGHNDNTVQMIAYLWRNIPGVQKFGQYRGTGSDLGAYIDCGFKPAIVITKAYSTNSLNNNNWIIKDTARDTYNSTTKNLLLNKTDQELSNPTHTTIDITENGFKLYNDDSGYSNYSGGAGTWDYIYMAFAEQPAFNLYGALSNAR